MDKIPEVDMLPSLSTVETESGAKESPLKGMGKRVKCMQEE